MTIAIVINMHRSALVPGKKLDYNRSVTTTDVTIYGVDFTLALAPPPEALHDCYTRGRQLPGEPVFYDRPCMS